MRGWPTPEGHPAAQVDGIGHEGVQCMRASIVTASGKPHHTPYVMLSQAQVSTGGEKTQT